MNQLKGGLTQAIKIVMNNPGGPVAQVVGAPAPNTEVAGSIPMLFAPAYYCCSQ